MANHISSKKRIRQIAKRRLANKYFITSTRTAIKKFRLLKSKSEATSFLPKIVSMIDRLAKRNSIHANKAANLKSGLMRHLNHLA